MMTKKEIQELSILAGYNTASGTNTYTVSIPEVRAYTAGLRLNVRFTNANTGNSTINVNSLGARSIVKLGNIQLAAGDITANSVITLVFDGTNFQVSGFRLLPNSPNKVLTTDGAGVMQATVDLVDVNSTTTEATLMAASWTNNSANVTGVAGTWLLGTLSYYFYLCTGTNVWVRFPAYINYTDLVIATINDASGIKTNTWLLVQYPSAVPGQWVIGSKGLYINVTNTLWIYISNSMPEFNAVGSASFSGDGSTTSFSVSFSTVLTPTPNHIVITPLSAAACGPYYISARSTTGFTITFLTAPAAGSSNVTFNYSAYA